MQSLLCLALSNAILATLLAAFVAVLSRFCRRSAVRHALWLLVLLKLITPPLVPISVSWPRNDEIEPLPAESTLSAIVLPESFGETANLPRVPSTEALHQPTDEVLAESADADHSLPSFADVWMPALIAVWMGGALAWWTVAAARLWKFRRLLRLARPATADVQEQGQRLAALLRLRDCPPIVFVAAPLSPMLWALGFSPRLLIPAELWQKLTTEQQNTLLAHELAHLRRGDHWARRLELLVLGLYWWHPVVWWAQRRLQEAEEECCDALVIAVLPDEAPSYAAALVETVAFLSQTRRPALVGASGVGHVPLLKRRLTMILTEPSSRKPSRIGFWIVLGLGALLLPLAPRAAWTEAPEEPQGEKPASLPSSLDFGFPIADRVAKPVIVADEMRSCLACHDAAVHGRDFQGKPQSWQHAHDEIIRLMDELHRRQAEFRDFVDPKPAAAAPDRTEEIEKLQDEIELLKVQVQLKEAQVEATRTTLEEHRRRWKGREAGYQKGAVPEAVVQEARLNVIVQEGQLRVNKAELQESQIRLKQAERRLARLQPPKPPATPAKPKSPERLQELEKKLDELRKEMDKLRREMQPDKPRDSASEHKDNVDQRSIHVIVGMNGGEPVIRVEDEAVDADNLASELRRVRRVTKKTQVLLKIDDDVPQSLMAYLQDAAKGAGMEKVILGLPDKGKR
ncbi:MAG TPA: M56 family metallopeptidase [Gemmataceae bacterium]|jgi:beta-lactamase regulating signal transducer with metallopeptidase domain/biopolymer transport protein ExbD